MLRILIVEDEDIIRKGLVFTIDWLSMDCVIIGEARDGREGLEKILEGEPDVVITDIKMPNMNGFEMIREAEKSRQFKKIFLTSYAEFDYAREAIALRAYDYLLKPVDEERIKMLMRNLKAEIENHREVEFAMESSKNSNCLDLNYYLDVDHADNSYVGKTIEKVMSNYSEKISIESIAAEFGVSPSYLSRRVKEVTEHTFLDLLNSYRVQQAIRLLNSEKYRVYEISEMVGFSDYKHFCTVFKRYTMKSPTNFIKQKK